MRYPHRTSAIVCNHPGPVIGALYQGKSGHQCHGPGLVDAGT